jgi:hypothetical protein
MPIKRRKARNYQTPANRYLKNSTRRWFSYVNLLREQGKLNEQVETAIHNLTLEDLIVIKMELSTRTQKSPLFGIPLLDTIQTIVTEAMLKYAISVTLTPSEAAASLGISLDAFKKNIWDFKIYDFIPKREEMLKMKERAKEIRDRTKKKNTLP